MLVLLEISLDNMIEIINDVSDTMLIVFVCFEFLVHFSNTSE